ncbi:uncharacterized protein LOC132608263 [Lycium barbarum]|uniref:uncharacterized protein LOC132608263 n=1 Tax=Lycium barbarum TaxID=112863 RepID=UPI00293E5642|nr:uncharacterized protein LOC132608263 [Lycium barbarum]
MISAIIWNIREVRSRKAIHKLKRMVNKHKTDMVAMSEPLVNSNKIEGYKRFLGFNHCISNINGKIWCFWRDGCDVSVIQNHVQQMTLKVQKNQNCQEMFVTAVYAKCTASERMELWSSLENLNRVINQPWCVGGEFNVILHPEEKIRGLPHRNSESYDFFECMDSCGMMDIGYIGSNYTWCNNWIPSLRIWKRLDRVFVNDQWAQKYSSNTVKHLPRVGSDHRPMLFKSKNDQGSGMKYFKFLNFWTSQEDFREIVCNTPHLGAELSLNH